MLTFLDFVVDAVNNDSQDCPSEIKNSINNMATTVKDFLAQPDWRDKVQAQYDQQSYMVSTNWTNFRNNWIYGYVKESGMSYANDVTILMDNEYTPPYIPWILV